MNQSPAPAIPEALDEGVIAFAFGDEDVDPGQLVTDGAQVPGFVAHLEALERDLASLKRATGRSAADSEACARLRVLREETVRWQASHAAAEPAPVPASNVVDLAAARKRRGARLTTYAGILLAAAAALVLVVRPWSTGGGNGAEAPRDVTTALVDSLTHGVGEESGRSFAGPLGPSPRDRGFLLGGILDLTDPKPTGAAHSAADRELARALVERALVGLDAPDSAEARLDRARAGCGALLSDPAERASCETGMADYRARRDAALAQ